MKILCYTFRINYPLEAVAPLLCAGITTYSPLRHWKVGKGTKSGYTWVWEVWAIWA